VISMCVAVPGKIVEISGDTAKVDVLETSAKQISSWFRLK